MFFKTIHRSASASPKEDNSPARRKNGSRLTSVFHFLLSKRSITCPLDSAVRPTERSQRFVSEHCYIIYRDGSSVITKEPSRCYAGITMNFPASALLASTLTKNLCLILATLGNISYLCPVKTGSQSVRHFVTKNKRL